MAEGETVVLRRYAQYVLDQLLVMVATVSATLWGAAAAYSLVRIGVPGKVLYLPLVLLAAVPLLGTMWAEVWVPHRQGGATPGMRRLGLRIVRTDGGEPSLRDYLVRWLLFAVDGLFLCLVGVVLIAVTPRHQRFGDLVARTVVVRERKTRLVPED
ncbi:RDD family protein [Umezawaea tangerina]|uniref:Putative RDD family membrane protein YckC n=1 Tax=Umezawaea tangerina TaxID=84725 RepID=A0A2T0TFJ9_9PSEU|nr:RDD family protein [Umezawaea tangerina]PRY44446.1 putative RDD family membrane protein YckC [Umezawaea tangerina]